MSYAKFAPITAGLLARKGEAAPSFGTKRTASWTAELPAMREPVHVPFGAHVELAHHEPVSHHEPLAQHDHPAAVAKAPLAGDKPRRIVVSMSACEFERLGIAAVKKNTTRHDLVRDTVNAYLQRLAAEFNERCACLNDGSSCAGVRHE